MRDLERLGYLTRDRDPGDGRAQLITFTAAGMRLLTDAVTIVREVEEEYADLLGRPQLEELRKTLLTLVAFEDRV